MQSTRHSSKLTLCALVVALSLSGCATLTPDYERPASPVPSEWPAGEAYTDTTKVDQTSMQDANTKEDNAILQLPWQSFITDDRMQKVIQTALDNNRDLRQTLADVEAARATYRIQRAELFPTVNAGVTGTRAKSSDGSVSTSYEADAGLSGYEIDLFGKNQSATEADKQSWLYSVETARAAKITLIAETANAWLTLASDQSLLKLAEETAENAQKAMEITRRRNELGVDSKVDVLDAQTTYHTAMADIASYTTQVAQDINALMLLAGSGVDKQWLPDGLPENDDFISVIPAGLTSDILLNRPDILAAEHNLKSANADIGAARANYFPSVTLTATGGLASNVLADIFTGGASTIWSLIPSVSVPIFTGGANDAQLDYAKANRDKMVAAYEYSIQTAFSDVADALARRGTIARQLGAQQDLVDVASDSYRLSLARYENGVNSFQDALTSQRTLYSAQQSLISTQLIHLSNRITLYRVMGGGLGGVDDGDAETAGE